MVDFGTGDYSNDYTGHAFLTTYLYERQKILLNNTFEYSSYWKKPFKSETFHQPSANDLSYSQQTNKQQGLNKNKNVLQINSVMYNQNQQLFDPLLSINRPNVNSLEEFSSHVFVNKNKIPINDWDPIVDNDRINLNRVPDRSSSIGFDKWYIDTISDNVAMENIKTSNENPFIPKNDLQYIDTYRFAKVWWNNETFFENNKQE